MPLRKIELDLLDCDQYHITFSLIILCISSVCYTSLHSLVFALLIQHNI